MDKMENLKSSMKALAASIVFVLALVVGGSLSFSIPRGTKDSQTSIGFPTLRHNGTSSSNTAAIVTSSTTSKPNVMAGWYTDVDPQIWVSGDATARLARIYSWREHGTRHDHRPSCSDAIHFRTY